MLSYRDNPAAPKELDSFFEEIDYIIVGKSMGGFPVNGMLILVW